MTFDNDSEHFLLWSLENAKMKLMKYNVDTDCTQVKHN